MKAKAFLVIALAFTIFLIGHPGRTDANGGHHDRKNGGYHYHNSGRPSSPPPIINPAKAKPATIVTGSPSGSNASAAATKAQASEKITEKHWKVAFNNAVTKGRLDVITNGGLTDIGTDEFVIEIDRISNYREGIQKVLKLAEATDLKPGLALYIDGEEQAFELYAKAASLCMEKSVKLWLINSAISVNDLALPVEASLPEPERFENTRPSTHWLNTNSGVRHNRSCRYFGNTANGRECSKTEGRACQICGG